MKSQLLLSFIFILFFGASAAFAQEPGAEPVTSTSTTLIKVESTADKKTEKKNENNSADKKSEKKSESIADKKPSYVMCKNGSVIRTLRVISQSGSCKAYYTKEGVDIFVGKSGTNDVCFEIIGKIIKTLESANWKCKDISSSRVSLLTE